MEGQDTHSNPETLEEEEAILLKDNNTKVAVQATAVNFALKPGGMTPQSLILLQNVISHPRGETIPDSHSPHPHSKFSLCPPPTPTPPRPPPPPTWTTLRTCHSATIKLPPQSIRSLAMALTTSSTMAKTPASMRISTISTLETVSTTLRLMILEP